MPTRFPNGVSSYGIPVLGGLDIPANATVLFVDSGHDNRSDGNPGTDPGAPLSTIDAAIGLCAANNGDHIFVMPGHAETVTSAITMDVAGVTIYGWGYGRSKPALTGSGAIDVITVTAANCRIHNLRLIGASASVTACINVAAADCEIDGCEFNQAETPLMAITVASGGARMYVHHCTALATANGPDAFVDFESSGSDNPVITDCVLNYAPDGLDLAVFRANADTVAGAIIQRITAIGLDATCLFVDANSSSAVGEGIITDCSWQHRAAATIADGLDLGGYGVSRISATDGPNRGAILLPGTSAT